MMDDHQAIDWSHFQPINSAGLTGVSSGHNGAVSNQLFVELGRVEGIKTTPDHACLNSRRSKQPLHACFTSRNQQHQSVQGFLCGCACAGNAYVDNRGVFKLPRILKAFVRGRECFDVPYFVEHNRDFFGKGPVEKVDAEVSGQQQRCCLHNNSNSSSCSRSSACWKGPLKKVDSELKLAAAVAT
jgi:hypothetical protein